jgi:hypothetical protein
MCRTCKCVRSMKMIQVCNVPDDLLCAASRAPTRRRPAAQGRRSKTLRRGWATVLLTTDARFARATTAASDVEPLLVR